MKLTNNEGHSLSIAVWLITDKYDQDPYPGQKHISATSLLKPTRMIILTNRLKAAQSQAPDQTLFDIAQNIPNRLGTAIHSGVENAWLTNAEQALIDLGYPKQMAQRILVNPTSTELKMNPDCIPVYLENRSEKKLLGWIISGEYDFIGDGVLEDFKTTGVYSYMMGNKDTEHILQGSIYRWLNPDKITADHMIIQYTFTDWSKLDAKIKKARGYPQSRIIPKKLHLQPLPEIENFIKLKLAELDSHDQTPEEALPYCQPEDLWQSATTYKYYMNPNNTKRSSGNFDNYPEAHNKMLEKGKGIVKEFPGKIRRCGYCAAFEACTQKDIYVANGTLQMP